MNILFIALGGAVGSVLRYLLNFVVTSFYRGHFPLGILSINVLGSFLMGLIATYALKQAPFSQALQSFVLIGLLGAFTTFSTFSLDVVNFWQQGHLGLGLLNILLSVVLCVLAASLGVALIMGK
ncbi:MAG: fluoride efflux transporter CrcB [Gammaproteobacteria bacterium CG11_big_fil_rev_8_21_14_0_20_46_22]|nr:MAG: fluoride efflux transporter CrcB [Gammaproteobacteria bacterium CG12_big_fil_rev_8_21_14_0_65_46_12]PIR12184.1 MAG: fluoride efflux transporter CrcB [Gammaproteobacteria bacterium CG11_big_fil_rev_8_21_14_0_20_46_22]